MILKNFLDKKMNSKYFIMSSLLFFDVFGVEFYFAKIESGEKQLLNLRKEIDNFFGRIKK